jgi:hypothetical protein
MASSPCFAELATKLVRIMDYFRALLSNLYRSTLGKLVVASAIVVIPLAIALCIADALAPEIPDKHVELRKVLHTAPITLIFAGLLGGVLKILLDDVVANRKKREHAAGFVENVLADLKAVYDQVGRARVLIPAHQSAETYASEMRNFIEALIRLKNVVRALDSEAGTTLGSSRSLIIGHVKAMEDYLEKLTREFREGYKRVADSQRVYEAKFDAAAKRFAESDKNEREGAVCNEPWELLTGGNFPRLNGLIEGPDEGEEYKEKFKDPLDEACGALRIEHARILGERPKRSA